MILNDLNNIESFLKELQILKKRSDLLDFLLNFYDANTKSFIIKDKWAKNINVGAIQHKTPKDLVFHKIQKTLDYDELENLKNWDKLM